MANKDQAAAPIPDELTITLRKPITLGETYLTLQLREPTAGEWLQFDKLNGVESDIKAVAIVSGVPEPAIRMLGARDLRQASEYLARFLFDALPTGANA